MNSFQNRDAFKRLLAALEPWLDRVVIITGIDLPPFEHVGC